MTTTATTTLAVDDLLLEMLAIPSPTGSEWRLAAALRDRLAGAGFDAEIDPAGNVVAGWGDGPREVMLLGHLDTVPGTIPPRREAGRIFGRGSVDAKGPLAAAITAVALQPRHGPARFTVIGCVDEEGDSRGARQVATRPSPTALIVLEPSGWDAVTVGYRGIVRAELRIEDALRHRAAPESTVADRLVALLARLQAQLEERGAASGPFHRADLRVTGLEVMDTGLRETAAARLQFRLPPTSTRPPCSTGSTGNGARPSCWCNSPPMRFTLPGTAGWHGPSPAPSAAREGPLDTRSKTGTADMNLLVPRWGCAAVAYGPGDLHLDHTPDEAVDIAELERAVAVLSVALEELSR